MEIKEVESLITYHQAGLDQYGQHMSPSSRVLEEKTIEALRKLKFNMESLEGSKVREAERILKERAK